jgi:hypothetical protein
VIPKTRKEARKMMTVLGMDYDTIHACPEDHVLYRGEHSEKLQCPMCNASRFRDDVQGDKVPRKVLRHFPIIPRLQRLFRCKSLAQLMDWHVKNRSTDDVMRVPSDSPAWKHIEDQWPEFKNEPRNLRFGLAMDGVNPFSVQASTWSTWPVVLVNYNIPPWLSIKTGHLLLALLIPGKYKAKNMDVYLAPLVDELCILWNGIHAYDISRPLQQRNFVVRGILMWTMHDYPGLSECSGIYLIRFRV